MRQPGAITLGAQLLGHSDVRTNCDASVRNDPARAFFSLIICGRRRISSPSLLYQWSPKSHKASDSSRSHREFFAAAVSQSDSRSTIRILWSPQTQRVAEQSKDSGVWPSLVTLTECWYAPLNSFIHNDLGSVVQCPCSA